MKALIRNQGSIDLSRSEEMNASSSPAYEPKNFARWSFHIGSPMTVASSREVDWCSWSISPMSAPETRSSLGPKIVYYPFRIRNSVLTKVSNELLPWHRQLQTRKYFPPVVSKDIVLALFWCSFSQNSIPFGLLRVAVAAVDLHL